MYSYYNVTDYMLGLCRKDITSPPVLQRVEKREVFVVRRQSICSARMTLAPIAVSICLPEDGVPKHTPFPSFADSWYKSMGQLGKEWV